ncbi:hypothetical protein OSTOST_23341 [Ostertagia ostertagi]
MEKGPKACIVFLFVGLVLTTLAVDVMGSACIERIHSLGRGLDAMALLESPERSQNSQVAAHSAVVRICTQGRGGDPVH